MANGARHLQLLHILFDHMKIFVHADFLEAGVAQAV
jgi:hypothetical protein